MEIATEFHGTLRWHLVAEEDGCKLTFTSTYALSAAWLPVTTARWHGPLAVLTAPQDHAPVAWRDWTMARRAA